MTDLTKSQTFRLAIALCSTLGAWIVTAPHWTDLTTTQAIGGLMMQGAIVVGTAFGVTLGQNRPPKDGGGDAQP